MQLSHPGVVLGIGGRMLRQYDTALVTTAMFKRCSIVDGGLCGVKEWWLPLHMAKAGTAMEINEAVPQRRWLAVSQRWVRTDYI